mgnify:FL=1
MAEQSPLTPVVHIVRRFSQRGGMERYVWRLVHGLVARGFRIIVICEDHDTSLHPGIQVIQVEAASSKKRWQQLQHFRHCVDQTLRSHHSFAQAIVHSHERSVSHQVTTFHGPLILSSWSDRLAVYWSRRLKAWSDMERNEVLGEHVHTVLPVSQLSKNQLTAQYPGLSTKRSFIAWPGVDPIDPAEPRASNPGFEEPQQFVFVGKEWRRKGLKLAYRIVACYRKFYQETASLHIYGPDPGELPRCMTSETWVHCHGWQPNVPFDQYHALIHPAKQEPFGMIIAEARRVGLPVLCSDRVGAVGLEFHGVTVCALSDASTHWAGQLQTLVASESAYYSEVKWTWEDLVALHQETVYPRCV